MKMRLGIFVFALLLLPPAGLWLSGAELGAWSADGMAEAANIPAVLLTTLLFAGYVALINHVVALLTGNSPMNQQRDFFLWTGAAGAVLAWLLVYLNLYAGSWAVQPENQVMQMLLYTPLFALLAPAVLVTRAMLGATGGLLRWLSRGPALPALRSETSVFVLLPLAALGLAGGAAWPEKLFWLMWAAPLLLLAALQLLWGEGTVFSGIKSGNWGRVVCVALSGLIVGNFVAVAYHYNGGAAISALHGPLFEQLGYAAFGLLCLQLGDVIAGSWRGKTRDELFPKKKFPIPIIVKKN